MTVAERVAIRYKAASVPKGLVLLIHAVAKAAGGPSFITSRFDTDAMRTWDKAEFYRSGQDEELLYQITESAKSQDIYDALQPFWRKAGFTDGELDWERLELDTTRDGIKLDIIAWGPIFRRYSEESDEIPSYDREALDPYFVEIPDDDAFLDKHLDSFAKVLGGQGGYSDYERTHPEDYPGYDQFKYRSSVTWKVNSEDLLRASVGKWIVQAGEAANWIGDPYDDDPEPRSPFVVEKNDTLTIERRRGDWPKELKRGVKLIVLRDARDRDKVPVTLKGQKDKLYFRVDEDRKGLSLTDLADSKKTLRVSKA